jgi:hypothetical protein
MLLRAAAPWIEHCLSSFFGIGNSGVNKKERVSKARCPELGISGGEGRRPNKYLTSKGVYFF